MRHMSLDRSFAVASIRLSQTVSFFASVSDKQGVEKATYRNGQYRALPINPACKLDGQFNVD